MTHMQRLPRMKEETKIGKTFSLHVQSPSVRRIQQKENQKGKQFSNHCLESQHQQQIHQSSDGQSFRITLHRMDDFTFTTSECLKDVLTELDEVCKNCSDRCHEYPDKHKSQLPARVNYKAQGCGFTSVVSQPLKLLLWELSSNSRETGHTQ